MSWYLRTRFQDPRRPEPRERHYLDNGEVWAVVGDTRELLATLDPAAVRAARSAVSAAHLGDLDDIPATGADQAVMTYEWQVPGSAGRWVDAAYPTVLPDAVDALEEALLTLEESAREA